MGWVANERCDIGRVRRRGSWFWEWNLARYGHLVVNLTGSTLMLQVGEPTFPKELRMPRTTTFAAGRTTKRGNSWSGSRVVDLARFLVELLYPYSRS